MQGPLRDIELQMRLAVHDIDVPKDIVLLSPDELARQRHVPGTIARAAGREGRPVYVRSG